MILVLVAGLAGACLAFLFVAVAREAGVSPAETAIAYEEAWDRLDFETIYDLSGTELRDGFDRAAFVASKRELYARLPERDRLVQRVEIDEAPVNGSPALAEGSVSLVTRLTTIDGVLRNELVLARRGGGWCVVAYALRPDIPDPADTPEVVDVRGGHRADGGSG